MRLRLFLFSVFISTNVYSHNYLDGANLSGNITIDNADCAIISPLHNNNLFIFERDNIPGFDATGTHVLHVNTGAGYSPRMSLIGNVEVSGLNSASGVASDDVKLKALNSEVRIVTNSPMAMTLEDGSIYSYKESLFFQTELLFENYLPGEISATASVLVECVAE
ncbi:hypothetical protein HGP28_16085 [Vibrio sp. SM6]|uniref:Fimbrial protein n=1 Tax=Vibrio agarilyticus TaxID=2726741 RepID=A0A7X8TTA1_9VIBR|nr:hypothetical protein [Vibrio agarilyticus]NLS14400.1 hypothetical protein [Vibrio agarilyticus]